MNSVRTITCKLPEKLAAQLDALARTERRSKSDFVREALDFHARQVARAAFSICFQPISSRVDFSVLAEREALRKLLRKYEDLPMSLADACLVRMAELTPGASDFTLDSHFRIERTAGNRSRSSCRNGRFVSFFRI
jgi:Arc/MetJ-type ribon-helix-helix transcriptional regulator